MILILVICLLVIIGVMHWLFIVIMVLMVCVYIRISYEVMMTLVVIVVNRLLIGLPVIVVFVKVDSRINCFEHVMFRFFNKIRRVVVHRLNKHRFMPRLRIDVEISFVMDRLN